MATCWRRYRVRGLVNPVSNLPNLSALRADRAGKKQALIAARVLNYEEIVSTLPLNAERQLIEQIVSRLARIRERAVITRTMPPANKTHITDEERAILGRWIELGAVAR